MKNPWGNIPTTAPFVLADDAPYVEAFDAICAFTDDNDQKLDTNFPHPLLPVSKTSCLPCYSPVVAENVNRSVSPGNLKFGTAINSSEGNSC